MNRVDTLAERLMRSRLEQVPPAVPKDASRPATPPACAGINQFEDLFFLGEDGSAGPR